MFFEIRNSTEIIEDPGICIRHGTNVSTKTNTAAENVHVQRLRQSTLKFTSFPIKLLSHPDTGTGTGTLVNGNPDNVSR